MHHDWQPRNRIEQRLKQSIDTPALAEAFWISRFYQGAVFRADYTAPDSLPNIVQFTTQGEQLLAACVSAIGISKPDAALALFGRFFHNDILVDYKATDIEQVVQLLQEDLLSDRLRFPFIWGRLLHDAFNDRPHLNEMEVLTNVHAWELMDRTPIGVFQHGCFVSGPLGIIRSQEIRLAPIQASVDRYFRNGMTTRRSSVQVEPAQIPVVRAYSWYAETLERTLGLASEWEYPLYWSSNRQSTESRTDYTDICSVIAGCILPRERTLLLSAVLKTDSNVLIRDALRQAAGTKGLKSLPPIEIANKLDAEQQLQVLLTVPSAVIVKCLDQLILNEDVQIPVSEVRYSRKKPPTRNFAFPSEISSLGIRPAHPEPFAALCSSILRAYRETGNSNDLIWRLGGDPTRGPEISLTEFIRREGPADTISKVALTIHSVAAAFCRDLQLDIQELLPITDKAVARILWKVGFEIADSNGLQV